MKKNKLRRYIAAMIIISLFVSLLTGCNEKADTDSELTLFPTFSAADFDGNEVTSDIFSENAVTIMTFWFTGCSACISEMPQLEIMNNELSEKDATLIGVCTDVSSLDGSLNIAKNILEENGANYKNIVLNASDEVNEFIRSIYAYPTMLLVNRSGEIVGEPIVGAVMSREDIDEIIAKIDEIIESDDAEMS